MYVTRYSLVRGILFGIAALVFSFLFGKVMGLNESSILANMIGSFMIVFLFGSILKK